MVTSAKGAAGGGSDVPPPAPLRQKNGRVGKIDILNEKK